MSCKTKCKRYGVCAEDCPLGNQTPCRQDCEVVDGKDGGYVSEDR